MPDLTRWTGPVAVGPFRFGRTDPDGEPGPRATFYIPDNGRGDCTPGPGIVLYEVEGRGDE